MKPIEEYYDQEKSSEYESTRRGELWQRENEVFEAILSRITSDMFDSPDSPTKRLKVLDLPAGTGRWIPFLQGKKTDYTGVDISQEMLRKAQEKIQQNDASDDTYQFIQSPYREYLPAVENEFDLVICTRFLPHFSPNEVEQIVSLLAKATTKYVLLQVRVTENRWAWLSEIAHFVVTARAGAIRRFKKAGRLSYSKVRSQYEAAVHQTGMTVEKHVVKKERFSSFEYWLLKTPCNSHN